MPHAKILTKQALYTLSQLHSELAGKLSANQRETKRFQVEAVMKLLSPDVNLRLIAPKRRNVGNPWFKRGTLARAVIDALRRSVVPMTTREIADALLAGKNPEATRHQAMVLQAAILAILRRRSGGTVVGDGPRGKWRLKETEVLHTRRSIP
jgi:DNA-binding transcriptional ArsR family regulator